MKSQLLRLSFVLMILMVGLAGTARAQDEPQPILGALNIIEPDLFITPAGGGEETRLIAESIFDPGETLRSDDQGVALITWFYDGTESALGQNSQLTLNAFSGDSVGDYVIDLELHSGRLVSSLGGVAADVSQNGKMTVKTPAFTVQAVRGQFDVWVSDSGETTLVVTQGSAEVLVGDAAAVSVDENQFVVGAGTAQAVTDDGVTPNLTGVCTATAPANLNVRLAPSQDTRRLGGMAAGQVFWVRAATEGNLWLQVFYQTAPEDEEGRNYGWVYGPAVDLNPDTCGTILRAPLDAALFGGEGADEPGGAEGESDPLTD
jgi:hypothetical protein